MNLQLSNFKKMSEDEHSATLRHPEGHQIKIAKRLLSPKMKSQLAALPLHKAEGGEVSMPEDADLEGYKSLGLKEEADRSRQMGTANSPTTVINIGQPAAAPAQIAQAQPMATMGAAGTPPPNGAEFFQPPPPPVTEVSAPAPAAAPAPAPAPSLREKAANWSQMAAPGIYGNTSNVPTEKAPEGMSGPVNLALQNQQKIQALLASQTTPQTQNASQESPLSPYPSGIEEQIGGIQKGAEAEANLGQAQAKLYEENANQLQTQQQKYQQDRQRLQAEMNGFKNDLANEHIDPNHYLQSLPTWGKISTAIGLLLGGIGGGAQNAAMKFVDDQMNRDIDAQKGDVGIKKSLLDANLQQWGNLNQAMTATRMMYNEMLANHLEQQKGKYAGPIAQANADKLIGGIHAQTGMMAAQFGMLNQANEANPSDAKMTQSLNYLRMTNPELAKNMEARYVPSIGLGSVPVPEKDRSEIISRTHLDKALNDLKQFSEKNSGTLLDRETINEGKTKAAAVQDAYRRANQQGVFREAEKEFVETMVDQDPTKFFSSFRTIPKYKAVIEDNQNQLDNLKHGYGLPVPFRPKSAKKF